MMDAQVMFQMTFCSSGGMIRAFSAKNSTCMRNPFVKIDHLDEASLQARGCDIYISHVVACNIHEFLSDMV